MDLNMYIESPLNYTGSKYKLLDQILPHFDYSKNTFVDLFTGGGSVFINILDKYPYVVINDKIKDLIGIYFELINNSFLINEVIKKSPNNQEEFNQLREDYNIKPNSAKFWALIASSTNNMMRFNKSLKYNQTYGKRKFNDNTLRKTLLFKKVLKNNDYKLIFKSEEFDHTIYRNCHVYLDPPYGFIENDDGTISNKQITEAGYNAFWSKEHDERLYKFIKGLRFFKSTFTLSGIYQKEDKYCWLLRKLEKDGYQIIDIDMNYNKVSRSGNKNIREVIIKG